MQKKITNESFEEFLQQRAEEFEMTPSSKVWKGIEKKTVKRKRKYYFTFYFFISSLLIGFILLKQEPLFIKNTRTTKAVLPAPPVPGVNNNDALAVEKSKAIFSKKPLTQNVKRTVAKNNSLTQTPNKSIVHEYWQTNLLRKSQPVHRRKMVYSVKKIPVNYSLADHFQKTRGKSNMHLAKNPQKDSKFSTLLFITPTVTYRKLSGNKSYLPSAAYSKTDLPARYFLNDQVSQMPDIGLELGITSEYHLAKNLKLRGGFQFNINRYNLKAYGPEASTNPFDYSYLADSMNRTSNLSKSISTGTGRLENYYLQLAAPVGMEIYVYGNEKMQFGIASTFQPTYLLGNPANLVSTGLKSFTRTPLPIRRWNLNTSFETFASYSTGNLRWQVGPQVRYQIFSSYVNKYPVKENLFDFGLKVGVSLKQPQ